MPPPAKKTRIRDPEFNRQRLIDSAVELMAEKGVEGISYKEVVERSGLSRSWAYLHFSGKDELVEAVREWIKEKLLDSVVGVDLGDNVYERVLFTTRLVLQYPDAARIMISDSLSGYGLGLTDPLYKAVNQRIKKRRKTGYMEHDLDPEVTTFIQFGSICSTLLFVDQHPNINTDKLAKRFAKQWSEILEAGIIRSEEP